MSTGPNGEDRGRGMTKLHDRVALVTGSSRGIGAAIASVFANEGARVVVHGRDRNAVESVRRQIEATGGQVMSFIADLTRYEEIEAMRERIEHVHGPVGILVANAGGSPTPPAPLEEIREADWRAAVDANLTATFLTIKCFLTGMKERGRGNIITISSAAARRPHPGSPLAYAAAKAGIELLTKDAAAQAGPRGVRVNCIAPETIMTETNKQQIPEQVQESLRENHPIRRLGTPEDVAKAALFLASDNSEWTSGIVVDCRRRVRTRLAPRQCGSHAAPYGDSHQRSFAMDASLKIVVAGR
jgi:3-oxoacyl-[acyl-carrier protein] reductase